MTGTELRNIRERLGWSQSKLARYLGMAERHATISDYERGEQDIPKMVAMCVRILATSNHERAAMPWEGRP